MGTLTFQATAGGSVNLLGPNISGTVNLTLPSADGTSGQPLQTNGSGTLSFANLAIANGGTGATSFTANQIHYGSFSQSAGLTFDGTNFATTGTATAAKLIPTGSSATGNGMYLPATNSLGFSTNGSERMRIDSSGNVGIGTTSPYAKLVVSDASLKGIEFGYSSGLAANFLQSIDRTGAGADVDMAYYLAATGVHKFYTGGSERMRIDSSGNLLVGKTAVSDTTVGFQTTSGGRVACGIASGDGYVLYSTSASAYRFYVTNAGQIYATSIVINAISDQRLKENVRDIDTGLNAIMALKPRRFDWKEGEGQDKKNVAGFIAQEFEDVFPECVGTTKAGGDGIEYKNINHETLIPTLVKAIQEQQALITSLTARITALEST